MKIVENYDTQGRHINSLIEKDGVKSKTDYVYDDNGRLCGYFHYERDNNLREKADYIYNAHGELIDILYKASNDGLRKTISYKYDLANMKNTRVSVYDEKNVLYLESATIHDENDRLIEDASYNASGLQLSRRRCTYDPNGNCVEQTWYEADGSISTKQLWEYDVGGNPIREIKLGPDGSKMEELSISSEFDVIGNWIKRVILKEFPDDRSSFSYRGAVFYRTIEYLE